MKELLLAPKEVLGTDSGKKTPDKKFYLAYEVPMPLNMKLTNA